MSGSDLRRDAALARYLHNERVLPLDTLNELVQACRSSNGAKGLPDLLVERGLLTRDQVDRRLSSISDIGTEPVKLTETAEWRIPITHWRPDGVIDDYRLIDRLGKGTMGSVYLCAHVKTGANCAMKTVKLSAQSELVERLRREGQAQAKVDGHPNVVRIHGQGKAHGRCYLVMEYCPGGDLRQRFKKRGSLKPEEAAALVRDLALGMAHMHAHGVTHRDLKPANVLFGDDGRPKLADFGLASFEEANQLTRAGDLVGTPLYMAPEQAKGRREDVGPPADVYALGVILFEALTGQVPFPGSTTVEVLEQLLNKPAPRASSLRPSTPRALDELCARVLGKRPDDRPDAQGLARALSEILAGETPADLAQPLWRKPQVLIAAGASLLVCLMALGAAFAFSSDPGEKAPEKASAGSGTDGDQPKASPEAAPLSWPFAAGQRYDCELRLNSEFVFAAQRSRLKRVYRMRWTVQEVVGDVATILASFDQVEIGWAFGGDTMEFDSRRPEHHDQRFMRMVGKSFMFQLERETGKVIQADDLSNIQQRIMDGIEGRMARRRYLVPELGHGEMRDVLQQLLQIYPTPGLESGWRRQLPGSWSPSKAWGRGVGPIEASFEVRRRTPEGLWIACEGKRREDRGEGRGFRERKVTGRWNLTHSSGLMVGQIEDRWESLSRPPQGARDGGHHTEGSLSSELSLRPTAD